MRTRLLRGKEGVSVQLVYPSTLDEYRQVFDALGGGRPAVATGELHSVSARARPGNAAYVVTTARQRHLWDPGFHRDTHIHLHAQAALQSKDGTSAGLAMVAALVSLFTGRPVRRGLAMTGEITLSGHVVRVGGVRQKVLAPRRRGLTTVVLPRGNEKQLDARLGGDDVGRGVTVHSVCRIDEFLELVLRPAEAVCSPAVESAAPLRAALAAGVPE